MADDKGRFHSMADYPERVPSFDKLKAIQRADTLRSSSEPLTDDERKNGPPRKRIPERLNLDALGVSNPSGFPFTSGSWPWKGSR